MSATNQTAERAARPYPHRTPPPPPLHRPPRRQNRPRPRRILTRLERDQPRIAAPRTENLPRLRRPNRKPHPRTPRRPTRPPHPAPRIPRLRGQARVVRVHYDQPAGQIAPGRRRSTPVVSPVPGDGAESARRPLGKPVATYASAPCPPRPLRFEKPLRLLTGREDRAHLHLFRKGGSRCPYRDYLLKHRAGTARPPSDPSVSSAPSAVAKPPPLAATTAQNTSSPTRKDRSTQVWRSCASAGPAARRPARVSHSSACPRGG